MDANSLLNVLISIAIPAFFVYLIFALDLYGTGKFSTVLIALIWGAVGAFVISWFFNSRIFLPLVGSVETVRTLTGPIVEEMAKALILFYLIQRPRFRYLVDGAIYGFAVGIGFSISENIYLSSNAPLFDTLSRVLSTTLMHATASGLVGVSLGRLRRARDAGRFGWPTTGILLAIVSHIVFNNINFYLRVGPVLLVTAIAFGFLGLLLIGALINQGLRDEKQRFAETLNTSVGVTSNERRAVQQLGGDAVEGILKELGEFFGEDKVPIIRRLLVIQANIGILNNNLTSPSSERLRAAWKNEIAALRRESNQLRNRLGVYVMSFLRGVFLEAEDSAWRDTFSHAITKSDPTQVHRFDMFMTASAMAGTVSAEELEATAMMLQKAEIFKDVTLADLENLSRAVTQCTFADSEIIFNEGDEGDTLYMIKQGKINLYKRDGEGKERLLRTMYPGDVVGELALLDGSPRSAQARAEGQTATLRLRREHFTMFVQSRPQVIVAVLKFLANRVRETTHALETSIAWAANVAQGNYAEARILATLTPKPDFAVAAEAFPTEQRALTRPATADTGVAVSIALGGAFSKVASILEKREQQIAADAGANTLDISELSEVGQKVMTTIMRDPIGVHRGLTEEVLTGRLEALENMPTLLIDLVENGWLIAAKEQDATYYKVNYKRRRGLSDTLRLWTKSIAEQPREQFKESPHEPPNETQKGNG